MKFPRAASWLSRRVSLWLLLLALVVSLLGILIWLAGRYASGMVQSRLERNAAEAVGDIRSGLNRNIQAFQALHARERSLATQEANRKLLTGRVATLRTTKTPLGLMIVRAVSP
jgi:hypothetical protein